MKINEELLGKRILYKTYFHTIQEGVIQEISPNGEYVKISGRWYNVKDVDVLDVLESKYTIPSRWRIGKRY